MKKEIVTLVCKYLISLVIGAGMVLIVLFTHDYFEQVELIDKYHILADAFTIPGVVFIMLGLLIALTNQGALTALGYMVKNLFKMLVPMSKKNHETYVEYVEARKKVHGYSFIIITGVVFLLVAIIFIILFYSC